MAVRGVNLGNWLVLEKWMGDSPLSSAQAADDRRLVDEIDSERRARLLEEHYRSYVTKATFERLALAGVRIARVPVPYHLFGSDHHVECVRYLDRAFAWAQDTGIGLLVDLHTVPMSQNAFDNGGYTGVCAWHRDPARIDRALDVLDRIARRYSGSPALWGIEPLNEPVNWPLLIANLRKAGRDNLASALRSRAVPLRTLCSYYSRFYKRVRPVVGPNVHLVFHDRFDLGFWRLWNPSRRDDNVWIDTHQYVCFQNKRFKRHDLNEYLEQTARMGERVKKAAQHHRIMVGEWCLGNNAPGLASKSADEQRAWYRAFADAQLAAWDAGGGNCFWSLRVAGARYANWSFETCVGRGWLDLRARQ